MTSKQLKALIREEIQKVLKEAYRKPQDNLLELATLLKRGKAKDVISILQDVAESIKDGEKMEMALDEAIEMYLDSGNRGAFKGGSTMNDEDDMEESFNIR